MMNLEQRMRQELHELADSVPPSPHPSADFERRLARKKKDRRRMSAMATAAAVVVAAVVIPLAMNTAAPGPSAGVSPTGSSSVKQPAGRFPLSTSTADKWYDYVLVVKDNRNWCVEEIPRVTSRALPCGSLGPWPQIDPQTGGKQWVQTYVEVGDLEAVPPARNMLLFVTAPEVVKLAVNTSEGYPTSLRLVTENPGARYFVVEFPGATEGYEYVAENADGKVLVSGMT